ncbi:MAG: hypothetical protein HZB56_18365 [Deltaproteobacteria bacterium]|nr:hypothetical protein [Deltaproteobacteria bacterium]
MPRTPRALLLALLAAAPAARAGELHGTVRYAGPERPRPERAVSKDRDACGASVNDESLLVNDGRLANVVVEVRGVPGPAPAPVRGALAQVRCRFSPHVQALPVGSTLSVGSSDAVLHSVHGWRGRSTAFNLALALPGEQAEQRLSRAGLVQVRCDVHDWMSAWIAVVEGPAAVTGLDGRFAIASLPPGSYTLVAWHERLGERTVAVQVPETGTAAVELVY